MDIKVKQRLVGAFVLLGLVVIILPIVFHSGNMKEQNITMSPQLPAAPEKPQVAKIVAGQQQLVMRKQEQLQQQLKLRKEKALARIKEQRAEAKRLASRAEKTAAHKKDARKQVEHKHAAPKKLAKAEKAWAVQVASFRDKKHAYKLREELHKKGYSAHVKSLAMKKGEIYRVIVGPVTKEREAKLLLTKLDRQMKMKGLLITFKPTQLG